jgi:poly(3-hydroxybutyrate) depolymerase
MKHLVARVLPVALWIGLALAPELALAQAAPAPDVLRRQTIQVNGAEVNFVVRMPRTAGPRPLILALHFGGTPTRFYGLGLIRDLMGPAFAELDPVIVAPTCFDGSWQRPRCEANALAVLDLALRDYPVDPARVLVSGFSMGGVGTWHFATKFPERFMAGIPVASRPPTRALPTIPMWALHSTDDEIFPIARTLDAIRPLLERDPRSVFEVIEGVTHFQTARFAEPLSRSVDWVRGVVWEEDEPGEMNAL